MLNISTFVQPSMKNKEDDEYMACSSPIATMKIKASPFITNKRRSRSTYDSIRMDDTKSKPTGYQKKKSTLYSNESFTTLKKNFDSRNTSLTSSTPNTKS